MTRQENTPDQPALLDEALQPVDMPMTATEMALTALNGVKWASQLKEGRLANPALVRAALYPKDGTEPLDFEAVMAAKKAKRHELTTLTNPEDAIPEDLPEFLPKPAAVRSEQTLPFVEYDMGLPGAKTPDFTTPAEQAWSPTAILDTLPSPEERVYDAAELAAGENLDRDR